MPQQRADNASQLSFPTVITWPEGWDDAAIIELAAGSGVIDPATARLLIARTPPFILGSVDRDQSAALTRAIRSAGGDAFSPSLGDLAALGLTMKIRDLRLVDCNLEVDIWRGLTTTIRRDQVQFLVRGRITSNADDDRNQRIADQVRANVEDATRFTRYGWAARFAAERNISRLRNDPATGGLTVSEKLDIHLPNGSVFQVDGDKFSFTILGQRRGHSDTVNMDLLTELIAHISPDEVVDQYFELFRPPPGHHRLFQLVPELRRNREDPAFAFYSRWSALLYRHVMGLTST